MAILFMPEHETNVDEEWESFLANVGIAMVPPTRSEANVLLTLMAPVSKQMFVALGPEKTKAMLKANLIESLRNAFKRIDGGE